MIGSSCLRRKEFFTLGQKRILSEFSAVRARRWADICRKRVAFEMAVKQGESGGREVGTITTEGNRRWRYDGESRSR